MFSTRSLLLGVLSIACVPRVGTAQVLFTESEFNPGSWTAITPFEANPPSSDFAWSAQSSRLASAQHGGTLNTRFDVTVLDSGFDSFWAPVMFNGMVYDPAVSGPITGLSASVRTLQGSSGPGFGVMRLWIEQGGRLFTLDPGSPGAVEKFPNLFGYNLGEPELVRTAVDLQPLNFLEIIPDIGADVDSHPDFAGSPMRFGVGYSLTTLGFSRTNAFEVAFDDVSFRVVPAPAALAPWALGAALAFRRRR